MRLKVGVDDLPKILEMKLSKFEQTEWYSCQIKTYRFKPTEICNQEKSAWNLIYFCCFPTKCQRSWFRDDLTILIVTCPISSVDRVTGLQAVGHGFESQPEGHLYQPGSID